uniref:Uncharacterized protein n=1 Tax=Bionectria ochroleuca TaxID=29856 RepID=A0A8H7TNG7_BIOOC
MFILSIPSFTWIKVEPSDSTPGPRAGHTCTMWDGQVVVVGGYIGNEYKCDSPGIHVFDASKLKWKDSFAAGDHPQTSMQTTWFWQHPTAIPSQIQFKKSLEATNREAPQ